MELEESTRAALPERTPLLVLTMEPYIAYHGLSWAPFETPRQAPFFFSKVGRVEEEVDQTTQALPVEEAVREVEPFSSLRTSSTTKALSRPMVETVRLHQVQVAMGEVVEVVEVEQSSSPRTSRSE